MAEAGSEVALVGLTAGQVAARRAAGETNDKPSTTSRTVGDIVKANVLTRFNFLLGSLFVVMLVVGSVKDALFGVVVVANAAIGVVQELRAKRTLDRLVVLSAPRAEVRRDGATVEIPAEAIVRGDVVGLRTGDQVVADGEVLIVNGAEIDESLLTGESVPASFGAYAVALTEQDLDIRQARTSATLVLLALGSWIVVLLARPLTAWRAALLGLLGTLTAAILALPAGRRFYDLRFASTPVLLGELGVILASMALLEVSWRIVGRRLGLRQIRPPSAGAHR